MSPAVRVPGHFVVGLGNPGTRYAHTRHNVGFRVVDRVAGRAGAEPWRGVGPNLVCTGALDGERVLLIKPQAYMNRSGCAVAPLFARAGADLGRVVVVHDDLDLPFGRLRIRTRGRHGGHNGVRSMIEELGSSGFLRVKVGIGRPAEKEDVVEYVLSPFAPEEANELEGILARAAQAVECLVTRGAVEAMNRFPT